MTGASIAAPAISSAQCDMSWNRTTLECTPQPAPPAWYTPPPPYAPSFASQDVPPPPATQPPWAPQVPMWSTRYHQWGFYAGGAWVPL
ncbi:hypothetical protein [Mycobacterium sp. 94-17]|uniref:hypothetical protein n=1 Tax=Mycobacterium sp. 94-17 TaxID=2986147 RepID=UPI002D1EB3A3|nr:hypothetical protein [Mycobacterium sp. 94-17]MEB4207904.1 hypothetical protein [Mycobacterium sp. 94-17]